MEVSSEFARQSTVQLDSDDIKIAIVYWLHMAKGFDVPGMASKKGSKGSFEVTLQCSCIECYDGEILAECVANYQDIELGGVDAQEANELHKEAKA